MKQLALYFSLLLACGFTAFTADVFEPFQVLDKQQLQDSINHMLQRVTEYHPQLELDSSKVIIHHTGDQFFRFNTTDLVTTDYPEGKDIGGVEAVPCDSNSHAPQGYIYFNGSKGQLGFLKLKCVTSDEVYHLQRLLVSLLIDGKIVKKYGR